MRQHASSGTDWEDRVGYSRAVRTGDEVHVAGTTATDEHGNVVAPGDPYEQATRAIEIVGDALREVDATLSDVVRTRLFVADIDAWEAVGRAHAAAFDDVRPATTMVEVSRLIDDDLVVEVEAVARCE
jgi:enamine deaminase RidA (YjgF/YER057c/UK114 family)